MKATISKNKPVTLDKETQKLINEAEKTIKKMDKANPFKEMEDDRKSRAQVSRFPLELMVGKVTVSKGCPSDMITQLIHTDMSPHTILTNQMVVK